MRERLRIARGAGALGRWELAIGRAPPALAGDMPGYIGLASDLAINAERHLPSGEAAIVINLGDRHEVKGHGSATFSLGEGEVAVMGVHDRPFRTLSGGRKTVLVTRLRPTAARALFGAPMIEWANRWLPLNEIDATLAGDILAGVAAERDWGARFAALDRTIGPRLSDASRGSCGARWAWDQIERSGGVLSIDALADAAGCSHKHLIAQFQADVGLTPKRAARVMRFNRVLRTMRRRGAPGAGAAAEFGYADQAHMISEFRTFAEASPTTLARSAVGHTLRD